jgi:hypothetical protein
MFLDPIHSKHDSLDGISPSQGMYLHAEQHNINTHNTDIHFLSGIRIKFNVVSFLTSYSLQSLLLIICRMYELVIWGRHKLHWIYGHDIATRTSTTIDAVWIGYWIY